MKNLFCVGWIALGLLVPLMGAAQSPPPSAEGELRLPAHVSSADRRFVVTGENPEDNLRMLRWMGKNMRTIENLLGGRIAIPAHSPIVLRLLPEATNTLAGATIAQRWEGKRLAQELTIVGLAEADHEDLLEAFTLLVAYRAVLSVQATLPSEEGRFQASIPAWFAIGLAQNLHSSTRARNRVVTLRHFNADGDGGHSAAEILNYYTLPRGRWATKAECGMFVAWMISRPDFATLRNTLLRRFAMGGVVDAPWLREQLSDTRTLDDLEKHWDLWRLHSEQIRPEEIGLLDDASGRLAAIFPISRERIAALGGTFPVHSLDAADLAQYRAETWFPRLIGALRAESLNLAPGQPPEFQRTLSLWDAWYQSLLDIPLAARETIGGRVQFPSDMRKRSAALLQEAQIALHDYHQKTRALGRYLAEYEERVAAENLPPSIKPPDLPRTPQQQYVDSFDPARAPPPAP